MSDNLSACGSTEVRQIAKELNKGHGDNATKMLLECSGIRMRANPDSKEIAEELRHSMPGEDFWKAASKAIDLQEKEGLKLIDEVNKAQGPDVSKHLCKLEITDMGVAKIDKTATCNVTEYNYQMDKNNNWVRVKDK